jgi:hypothetical protein
VDEYGRRVECPCSGSRDLQLMISNLLLYNTPSLTSVVSVVLPAGVEGVALLFSCLASSSLVWRAEPGASGTAVSLSDILVGGPGGRSDTHLLIIRSSL